MTQKLPTQAAPAATAPRAGLGGPRSLSPYMGVTKPHKCLAVLWEAELFQAPPQMLVFFSICFIVW